MPEYNEVFIILKDLREIKRREASVWRVESFAALVLGMPHLVLLEDLPAAMRVDLKAIEY